MYCCFFFSEPLELEETAKVDPLSLPLQSLENNLVIVPCDDDIPCTLGKISNSIIINNFRK